MNFASLSELVKNMPSHVEDLSGLVKDLVEGTLLLPMPITFHLWVIRRLEIESKEKEAILENKDALIADLKARVEEKQSKNLKQVGKALVIEDSDLESLAGDEEALLSRFGCTCCSGPSYF